MKKNKKYDAITFDLALERIDERINIAGDFMLIPQITGNASIKFDKSTNDPLNLIVLKKFNTEFTHFYLSNPSQPNKILYIVIGKNESFKADTMIRPNTLGPIGTIGGQIYTRNITSTNNFIPISNFTLLLMNLTITNRHATNGILLNGFEQTESFQLLAGESLPLQNINLQFLRIKSLTTNQHANIELIGTQN